MLHTPTRKRRLVNTLVLLIACVLVLLCLKVVEVSLGDISEWSGWILLCSIVVLIFYAVRKRLSTLPIGRVAIWLQVHIYLGLFSLFVFALHIELRWPTGWFETALAISMLGTVITGLIGLYWSRTLPTIITRLGDEVLYERIKGFSVSLRDTAEEQVLEAVKNTGSHALSDFYKSIGQQVFAKPNFQWRRLYRAYSPMNKIERKLSAARALMNPQEAESADQFLLILQKKELLDAHYTYQGVLKHWLFIHLAFSLAMIPLIAIHVILVYSFGLG